MPMLEEKIIRSEVFLKIQVTNKKLKKLSSECFPTAGPNKIIILSTRVLEKIIERYDVYSIDQLLFIKTGVLDLVIKLIAQIEYSTMKNVTWSIIPAYDMLFRSLLKDTEYIIVPQWEENYGIWNINLVDEFKKYLSTPNFLFDVDTPEKMSEQVSIICKDIPSSIYIILYSRLEKLSALHLALLGHEIGHIFASKWISEKYTDFLKNTDLLNRIKIIVEESMKKSGLLDDMFKDYIIKEEIEKYNRSVVKNYCELLSDIFGCALFGHTYIVASYLYSALSADIDKNHWEEGYLSWKFRLQNCDRFLQYIKKRNPFVINQDLILYSSITDSIHGSISDNSIHPICNLLIDAFRSREEEIFEDICIYANNEIFSNMINDNEITSAKKRLTNNIVPNAQMKDGVEIPIDIKNILFALWIVCYPNDDIDIKIYSERIQLYNLLGIKGIELSVEQRKYNDFIQGSDNRKTES